MNWLGQYGEMIVRRVCGLDELGGENVAGHKEHFATGLRVGKVDGQLDAVHFAHEHVSDHHAWAILASPLQSLFRTVGDGDDLLVESEDFCQSIGDYPLVVHHEDPFRCEHT